MRQPNPQIGSQDPGITDFSISDPGIKNSILGLQSLVTRSTQPSTLCGTVKWAVTHLYGLRKVMTLVQLTGAA